MRCVPEHRFTVAKALAWRSAIDDSPSYQRPADRWSAEQRGRFIDSLLNGYDVPKLYFHDLRGIEPIRVYAVIDGKQRLNAIWDFAADRFPLAPDFRLEADPDPSTTGSAPPRAGQTWSELAPAWQRAFLRTDLSVVLVQRATEADIDALFFRLNDGVPLTAEERRGRLATAADRRNAREPGAVAAGSR
ncbi:MAG: hypothetical protein QOF49_1399 [Chloroflexota bacterium]|jgi:hypothetical protein|nr:hypothetical protein [Chloroflexota bacterium]